MASGNSRRRSRSSSDEDSDDDHDRSAAHSVRRDNGKRARISRDDSLPSSGLPLLPNSYRSNADESHVDGMDAPYPKHQPGSIVRVTLKNFVTYTAAEFFPGSSLNMVIGPNGTGKSTLVCAICLGLGAKTDVLGRAKDISDFVHHGAREAEIEIELAADARRLRDGNPVVKRIIKKSDNKTTWLIDGKPSSNKAVLELCRSFSIQIDNLCQFLPQDRVVEFAALTPVELLSQTQRAAAPEHMTEWHNELKEMRAKQRGYLEMQENNSNQLKNLEGRQNSQRETVERLRARAEAKLELTAMKKLRPFPQYNVDREAWKTVKNTRRKVEQELALLQQQSEPALRAVTDKQIYVNNIQKVVTQRDRVVKRVETQVDGILRKQEQLVGDIKACDNEVNAEKESIKVKKQSRLRLETEIRNIKRQLENAPPDFNMADSNEQTRDISRRVREKEDLKETIRNACDELQNQVNSRDQRIEMVNRNLSGLRSKAGQQANKLRTFSRDTATAWDWIQANRERFSGNVFGPPLIECSMKDQKHAKAFEASLGQADCLAITVTDVRDYNMLQDELLGKMQLADVNIRSLDRALDTWQPPMSREELLGAGLTGWVLDLIEGPDEVLSMLCDNRNIHTTAYSLRDINTEQYEALARSVISSWVTPSESYTITRRREYGDQGTSTRTQRLRDPRFFTNQPVDSREEERLNVEKRELQGEREELVEQINERQKEHSTYDVSIRELRQEVKRLAEEKSIYQKAKQEFNKLAPKLEAQTAKLEESIADASNYRIRVQGIRDRQEKLVLQRAEESLKLMATVASLQKLQTDLFEAEVLLIEAQSDLEIMQARNEEVRTMLLRKQQDVAHLQREETQVKNRAQATLNQCNAILAEALSEKEKEIHDLILAEKKTPDEWEADIEATVARLEMFQIDNPNIIEEYEARAKDIDRTRAKLNRLVQELTDTEGKIAEVRGKWEPELDALVGQISEAFGENFARIGCAGEVTVYKDENFEQWAINIGVRFRESEQLSILDSHRQSGGERAVSTIFYLMALQTLARAPFRVVDEINQGMDPRNERMVHSRIVDIACATNTSQYFLVTPKLLPNLKYHPHMKVHCIASGEYMPEDHRKLDFRVLADKALQVRGYA